MRSIASHHSTREDTATKHFEFAARPKAALRGPPERRADQSVQKIEPYLNLRRQNVARTTETIRAEHSRVEPLLGPPPLSALHERTWQRNLLKPMSMPPVVPKRSTSQRWAVDANPAVKRTARNALF